MKSNIKEIIEKLDFDTPVIIKGWVRNKRGNKDIAFVNVNDGSTIQNIQTVIELIKFPSAVINEITTGACVHIKGTIKKSAGKEQAKEVYVEEVEVLGKASPQQYKLQPKKHSLDFLRSIAHLRPRTNTFSAIFRIRHGLAFAIHQYFNDKGFYYWHSPLITDSDAEGAGEVFKVTSLDLNNLKRTESGEIDHTEDFFGKPTNLTVTGQLEGELGALAMGLIYTFGPTFRAENSNTSRHLSEFWMIEPEMAFYEHEDNQDLAEDFIKYLVNYALATYPKDLAFLDERFRKENEQKKMQERSEKGLLENLKFVVDTKFERLTYTEAIAILKQSKPFKKNKFKVKVEWGIDLNSEHERFLVEKHFKKPIIITDYPKDIKPFYMKLNEDGKTVKAMDILFPGIGEIVGGSQREDRLDVLKQRMDEVGVSQESLWWYLETREFGSAPHSGFGLGFDRMVQFVTGMGNIRDVIPFPRTPQNAMF